MDFVQHQDQGLRFKFDFDVKKAMVSLDVEPDNLQWRIAFWENWFL